MKHSIRVVMRSGYSFSFLCDNFKVKSLECELIAYAYDGAIASRPMFIRIEDIDAIIDEGAVEDGE